MDSSELSTGTPNEEETAEKTPLEPEDGGQTLSSGGPNADSSNEPETSNTSGDD